MLDFKHCIIQNNGKNILEVNGILNVGKYVITGKNGQGKTTFLRLLNKELDYLGSVKLDESELKEVSRDNIYSEYLSYMPQDVILSPYVTFNTLIKGLGIIMSENDLLLINALGVPRDIKINTMSNGQKQKVALLMTLFRDTKIILLDEPFNNMDQKSIEAVLNYFEQIENKIFIIITHSYITELFEQGFIHMDITNNILNINSLDSYKSIDGKRYMKVRNNNFIKHSMQKVLLYILSNIILYLLIVIFCRSFNIDVIAMDTIELFIQTNRENIVVTTISIIIAILVNIYLLSGFIKNNSDVVSYFKFNNLYYSFKLIYLINIIIVITAIIIIIKDML